MDKQTQEYFRSVVQNELGNITEEVKESVRNDLHDEFNRDIAEWRQSVGRRILWIAGVTSLVLCNLIAWAIFS